MNAGLTDEGTAHPEDRFPDFRRCVTDLTDEQLQTLVTCHLETGHRMDDPRLGHAYLLLGYSLDQVLDERKTQSASLDQLHP